MIPALVIIISCYTIVKLCDIVSKQETHPLVFWLAIIAIVIIGWQCIEVCNVAIQNSQDVNNLRQYFK